MFFSHEIPWKLQRDIFSWQKVPRFSPKGELLGSFPADPAAAPKAGPRKSRGAADLGRAPGGAKGGGALNLGRWGWEGRGRGGLGGLGRGRGDGCYQVFLQDQLLETSWKGWAMFLL